MVLLHDPAVRDSIRSRIESLAPASTARWGRMSVGQMMWHCNQILKTSLRDIQVEPRRPPFPVPVLKLMLFNMPWPHGAPTAPEYMPSEPRDFDAERSQCLTLIDRFLARKMEDGGWGRAVFGEITCRVEPAAGEASRSSSETVQRVTGP
jgi:hypothetical protein